MGMAVLGEGKLRDLVLKRELRDYYEWMEDVAELSGLHTFPQSISKMITPSLCLDEDELL